MKLLAVDPGETTGMCIVELDGYKVEVKVIDSIPYEDMLGLIRDGEMAKLEYMIIETFPTMTRTTEQIKKVLNISILMEELFPMVKLRIIQPSWWKYMAKNGKWKVPTATDQHSKDAYNIMRFFIYDLYNLDIGDSK